MAKQTICDRCGAVVVDEYKGQRKVNWNKLSDSYFIYVGTTRSAIKTDALGHPQYDYHPLGKTFDLCEDCKDSLYKWFTKK